MLRLITVDLIAACLAFTSTWLTPLPTLPPPPAGRATDFAASVQADAARQLRVRSLTAGTLGIASWYGAVLDGHTTASGEIFHKDQMTACHRTLPFGTIVRVVDLHTGKSVVVRINDRGVLSPERVIDLSSAAAQELGILRQGVAPVRLEVLGRTSRRRAAAEMPLMAKAESSPR